MGGRLIDAWQYSWIDIWSELEQQQETPRDFFMQLYPELVKALVSPPERKVFDTVANDPMLARRVFEKCRSSEFRGDRSLGRFFEKAYLVIEEIGRPELSTIYFSLVESFLVRYNLRFKLGRPFQLSPHVTGVFATLISEMAENNKSNPHLWNLLEEFDHSFETLAHSRKVSHMKSCILKACNHVEGIACRLPGIKAKTLGEACKELNVWPHATIREALSSLYGFCSDYPGIRHAGNPSGQIRQLDLRDSVLITLLLLTFSGYFADNLDFEEVVGLVEK